MINEDEVMTSEQAFKNFHTACVRLGAAIAEELRLRQILEWIYASCDTLSRDYAAPRKQRKYKRRKNA